MACLAADYDQEGLGILSDLDGREPASYQTVPGLAHVPHLACDGVQDVHGPPGTECGREGVEFPFADVNEAIHIVGDALRGGAVASEDLSGVHDAAVAHPDGDGPPGGFHDLLHPGDEVDVLDRREESDPLWEVPDGFEHGVGIQSHVGAGFDVQDVGVVSHGRDGGMSVVDQCIGPPSVIEQIARAVARAADDEDRSTGPFRYEFRNLRGPYLQALGKLDRDGGEPSVADPFHNLFEF